MLKFLSSSPPMFPLSPSRINRPLATYHSISTLAISRLQPSSAAFPAKIHSAAADHHASIVLQHPTPVPSSPSISLSRARLGLLSLSLVISTVIGSFLAVAMVSLPLMGSLWKLKVAMERLSKTATEEVPGSLMSLKLSAMELLELAHKLGNLRRLMPRIGTNGREDTKRKGR